MLGGEVLGLLEAFAASYLSLLTGGAFGARYKDIFAFSILILILIFRPKASSARWYGSALTGEAPKASRANMEMGSRAERGRP